MTDIVISADLWEEDVEGVITAWLFDDGDIVTQNDILAELMVAKVQYDICAPLSGKLHIIVKEEQPVMREDVIGMVVSNDSKI